MDIRELADTLNDKIGRLLPEGLANTRDDLQGHMHTLIQETLSTLNLVSREEFELQQEVLLRTRLRLEQAEKDLRILEQRLDQQASGSSMPL